MERIIRISAVVFMALTIIGAVAWTGRELSWWAFERPENLSVPVIACGVIAMVLSRIKVNQTSS